VACLGAHILFWVLPPMGPDGGIVHTYPIMLTQLTSKVIPPPSTQRAGTATIQEPTCVWTASPGALPMLLAKDFIGTGRTVSTAHATQHVAYGVHARNNKKNCLSSPIFQDFLAQPSTLEREVLSMG